MAENKYDVVVLGASGFTGKWVVRHLFENYPQSSLKWAIAGRDQQKLKQTLLFIGDDQQATETLAADSADKQSLLDLVAKTKVIITTVGPYAQYGSLLVEACAESGTHYVDLAGETPWMREMIDRHHQQAQQTGAKIVHTCGFDSLPSDIGVHYLQQQAQQQFGNYFNKVHFSLIASDGGMSGGTVHSMLGVIEQAASNKKTRSLLVNAYSLNPDISFKGPDYRKQDDVVFNQELGRWTAPFIMEAINTRVVRRSNALQDFKYGQDFSYTESMATGKGFAGRLKAHLISLFLKVFTLTAVFSWGRKLLSIILPNQGDGPKVDPDNPGFYVIDIYGEDQNGNSLTASLSGDADPGYGSTGKMLAEAGVCLVLDDDKIIQSGGVLTPSVAMGDALLERLHNNAGLTFSIKQSAK